MKYFKNLLLPLLLIMFCTIKGWGQNNKSYDTAWKKIDELIQKKNLPKSALTEVKKIYSRAKKEGQDAQVIKSLVYMIGLQQETRENNLQQAIQDVDKEIAGSREPVASILKSLEANLFWQYLQQNRYQLYDRTNTVGFNKEGIATWTLEDLHKKISDLYLQSIKNEQLLKDTKLERYDAIIIKGNTPYLRPTLFDLLAHQALEYFKNDERDIKKPAYAFEIDQQQAFAPAAVFSSFHFNTKDSFSLQQKALLIYQQLIAFHLRDQKPEALIDVDIERIQFVHDKAVMEDKEDLYRNALSQMIQTYGANPIASQASYLLAASYSESANTYEPFKDTTHRYDRIKAKEILERVVKDSAVKSEGWVNSYNLLHQIMQPEFSFKLEKVNIPDQPFRALISYTNVSVLNFRLIKADEKIKDQMQRGIDDELWEILTKAAAIKTWEQNLPATNDLQKHAVEVKIDGLPVGEYILLASQDKQYNKKTTLLGAQLFYVSNISFINKDQQFFVLHRETGQPLSNASIQLYQKEYDYKTSKYISKKLESYSSDKNGLFSINEKKDTRRNYLFDIRYGQDRLFMNEALGRYYGYDPYGRISEDSSKPNIHAFFFTDRSIYRPGQIVYFKTIFVDKRTGNNSIVSGYKTRLYLKNANSETVDSLELTSNEYGSVNGKFTLPQNVLNGAFSIEVKGLNDYASRADFSVEEYKRPKFYVDFEKIHKSYKVNDTISLSGTAKAYAGNVVEDAKVVYRIVRQPRFIYFWSSPKWWFPPTEPMEIAHGETITDKEGKFTVQFTAIPDRKLDPKLDPLFDYQVYADVTDINGETRSGEKRITASYKSLLLKVEVDNRMPLDSFKKLYVHTENMNEEYQPATVIVNISKLVPENRLIRERLWDCPDQFVMSKEEFIRNFPHDEYENETDYKTWPVGEKVFSQTDSTQVNGDFKLSNIKLQPGFYQIESITKDKDGQIVKNIQFTELYDSKSNNFNKPDYLWTKGSGTVEPGQKATVQVGSSADHLFLVHQTEKGKTDNNQFDFVQLNDEKKSFDYNIQESDRGGFGTSFFFVKDNRFYQFNDVVNVPWTNKELNIEYASFRDKTLPGSEEQWKVKISGYKNEKVAAEMLASMYDASLDQFRRHVWLTPFVWESFLYPAKWTEQGNFVAVESEQRWVQHYHEFYFDKSYDVLGFEYNSLLYKNVIAEGIIRGIGGEKIEIISQEGVKDENIATPPISAKIKMAKFAAPVIKKDEVVLGYSTTTAADSTTTAVTTEPKENPSNPAIQIRKNFNETAFFFPNLHTDKDGNIEFSYKAPEALTTWKLQTFAHTKDLAFGLNQKEVVTQKQLMVQPNVPRFLRQGDHMEFAVKIVNMADSEMTGQVQLELIDATTNQSVDGWFMNTFPNQYFTVSAGQSEVVKFPIQVPFQFNKALVWRVTARSGNSSDGEEDALPVLSNKLLVTETLPLPMRGTGNKQFTFEKLLQSGNSETLQNQALTVEYTSNPAWYAVQALPYLMEFPYECAEQTWNRYYANALASKIAGSSPRMKQIFEQWKNADTAAFLSNLQKNQELKSVLLEETPWVLQATSEEQQKKNIALLFDMMRMNNELKSNLEKLQQMQSENGGFVWFKGGPDDRYITQYIVTGIGHLKKLGVSTNTLVPILKGAIPYLDKKIKEDYDNLIKYKADLSKQQISYLQIQYLYMRSFFDISLDAASKKAYDYYRAQSQKYWMKQNKYMQGMIALTLNRTGDTQTSAAILKSLKETSINNEEMGMYWKDQSFGYGWMWWYAPIETQALMIEAFSEVGHDTKTVDDLRTWLLKNKQTNNWHTTKATADACYALLLQGTNWLSAEPVVGIKLGNTTIYNTNQKSEAGTGYFKQSIPIQSVNPEMGNITVSVKQSDSKATSSSSWGAVYWQYFEDMDKITTASTPLQLKKKLFIEKLSDRGPVLTPVEEGTELHVGDKIVVRIELKADRDMEYVHMKDMRASGLEPVNVISGYKWQGGLGYYESTKDASTNFFFNFLRKGSYVFEYPLFVTHAGDFTNGITTIQCMYAPEFSAHSEGSRITVE